MFHPFDHVGLQSEALIFFLSSSRGILIWSFSLDRFFFVFFFFCFFESYLSIVIEKNQEAVIGFIENKWEKFLRSFGNKSLAFVRSKIE